MSFLSIDYFLQSLFYLSFYMMETFLVNYPVGKNNWCMLEDNSPLRDGFQILHTFYATLLTNFYAIGIKIMTWSF